MVTLTPVTYDGHPRRDDIHNEYKPGAAYPVSLVAVVNDEIEHGRRVLAVQIRSDRDKILPGRTLPFISETCESSDLRHDFLSGQPHDPENPISKDRFYRLGAARGLRKEGGILLESYDELRPLWEGLISVDKPFKLYGVLYGLIRMPEIHDVGKLGDGVEGVEVEYRALSNKQIKRMTRPLGGVGRWTTRLLRGGGKEISKAIMKFRDNYETYFEEESELLEDLDKLKQTG